MLEMPSRVAIHITPKRRRLQRYTLLFQLAYITAFPVCENPLCTWSQQDIERLSTERAALYQTTGLITYIYIHPNVLVTGFAPGGRADQPPDTRNKRSHRRIPQLVPLAHLLLLLLRCPGGLLLILRLGDGA